MRHIRMAALAMLLLIAGGLCAPAARADVSFDFFYSNLSPHGSWLVSGQYGRVWQPEVYSAGWNPYYDGHWVYTDLGWTWVSDYEWGAVPYHYGTWVADPALGWVWVPGYTWAPAWVVFRTGPDYIGWAPVSPSFSVGVSAGFGAPVAGSFVFVSAGDFAAPRIRSCVVPRERTTVIINRTRVVNNLVVENNVVVNRGPDVTLVEKASHQHIREVPIERVGRVAPGPRFSREQVAVDPGRMRGGVRAAEPVRGDSAAPGRAEARGQTDARGQAEVRGQAEGRGKARPVEPAGRRDKRDQRDQQVAPAPRSGATAPQSPESPSARSHSTRRHEPPQQPSAKQQKQRRTKPRHPAPGQQQSSNTAGNND